MGTEATGLLDALGYVPTNQPALTIAARLVIASILGGALGLEREFRHRAAGLRTYLLTSLAAALFTVVAIEIANAYTFEQRVVADPVRIVDAVTGGVAFLAAGTIISQGRRVRGLTTGAGMWAAGAIGVTCGAGFYAPAVTAALLSIVILAGVRRFEHHDRDDAGE